MCLRDHGNFFEPGSVEPCGKVLDAEAKIIIEIESGERGQMSEDAIFQLAGELVHGDEPTSKEDLCD